MCRHACNLHGVGTCPDTRHIDTACTLVGIVTEIPMKFYRCPSSRLVLFMTLVRVVTQRRAESLVANFTHDRFDTFQVLRVH